jgi:alginate O-acetyltransferase complex protein AlgI
VSTISDYFIGLQMEKCSNHNRRKLLLFASIIINIVILFYFKYFNFLSTSIEEWTGYFGYIVKMPAHHFLLPVGISFYTFQTLSYTIDVYRKQSRAESNPINFALYVSFFPQLVAGPIERSTRLLPQFEIKHRFNYDRFRLGAIMILIGLFKKLVIADRFAEYVDIVFSNPEAYGSTPLILGAILFSFQIYCDFSGYTDIAIGSAKILGFNLMPNFKGPYFSKGIRDFWRRWHISLSTWFRDYLYIPLGGSKVPKRKIYRNLLIVFVVTGLWHGASWVFLIWGLFHGFFIILERTSFGKIITNLPMGITAFYTYTIVTIGWIFFRSESIAQAFLYFKGMFNLSSFDITEYNIFNDATQSIELHISLIFLVVIIPVHYFENKYDIFTKLLNSPLIYRWISYVLLIFSISIFGAYGENSTFIYFQF